MTKFGDKFDQDAKDNNIGGGWLKIKEGDNNIRIVEEPKIVIEKWKVGICYKDCGYCGKDAKGLSTKYMAHVIDREDGSIKLYKIPYKLTKQIIGLMGSKEYGFEDFPMPYDINVQADDKVGTKDVTYTLIAARKNIEITEDEQLEIDEITPVDQIIEAMKEKQKSKIEAGESDASENKVEYE